MPGIGYSAGLYIQLLLLCDVGKAVDDDVNITLFNLIKFFINAFNHFQDNMVLDALNDFPIYFLPIKKQKLFLLLTNCMQNRQKLTIGPFAELNYETLTQVSHLIN